MFSVTDLIGRFGRPVEVIAACLTTASVVTAVAMYIMDKPTRERTALFDAWRMVVHMESRRVSGARAEALAVLLKNRESLAGVDLSNAILDDIDLRGSVLSFASLEDVRFSRVKLNRALLRGASLRNGHFEQRCDFTDAVFDRTQLQGAVLADNTLVRATFSGTEASLTTSFNGADLRSSVTVNAEFSGVNFDNADLSGAKMVEGRVENATFQRATLADFRMAGTFGAGAQFQKSTGLGAVFASTQAVWAIPYLKECLCGRPFSLAPN